MGDPVQVVDLSMSPEAKLRVEVFEMGLCGQRDDARTVSLLGMCDGGVHERGRDTESAMIDAHDHAADVRRTIVHGW